MSLLSKVLWVIPSLLVLASAAAVGDVPGYCSLIESKVPGSISYPNSETYNASISSYYSGQESQLHPGCIFSPKDTSDVSEFVKLISNKDGCAGGLRAPQFAVRSGGHTIWTGAANIDNGITVDLRALNSLVLNEDKTVASIGAGGIWSEIYPQLVPLNLTVMGGRVPGIGVGGFSTGGGISYLGRRHGWGCDNIYGYEVVLASGETVYATAASQEDLWLALKGGSNNFGIVTRFDVPTFPIGLMWGGGLAFAYSDELLSAYADAFNAFMDPKNFDDAADMGMALVYQDGAYGAGGDLYYVEPVANPPIYQPFTAIPNPLASTLRFDTPSGFVLESTGTLSPNASRAIDIVYSFKNARPDVYFDLFKSWENGTKPLASIEGLQLVLLVQPHPVTNGTNSLGLPPGETDLVMSVITAAYTNSADDDTVQKGMQAIVDTHIDILRKEGIYIPYQYLNYADKSQDPISSYGLEVKTRLQAASKKYDPHGLFQKGVPGGFKLFR